MEMKNKEYIGGGVYVSFDGVNFILETELGDGAPHSIGLEPEVLQRLGEYVKKIIEEY